MDKMTQWREGLLSDAEIMAHLIVQLAEVQQSMLARETEAAEKGLGIHGKHEASRA